MLGCEKQGAACLSFHDLQHLQDKNTVCSLSFGIDSAGQVQSFLNLSPMRRPVPLILGPPSNPPSSHSHTHSGAMR